MKRPDGKDFFIARWFGGGEADYIASTRIIASCTRPLLTMIGGV